MEAAAAEMVKKKYKLVDSDEDQANNKGAENDHEGKKSKNRKGEDKYSKKDRKRRHDR